jgi:hypothetical protein
MTIPYFSTNMHSREAIEPGLSGFFTQLPPDVLHEIAEVSWAQSRILIELGDKAIGAVAEAFDSGNTDAFYKAASAFELTRAMLAQAQTLGRISHTSLTAVNLIQRKRA